MAVACGGGGTAEPGARSTTYDGTWELVEGTGPDGEIRIVDGYRITLDIDGETLGGTSACNSYFAEATIDGSEIRVDGVGGTEMACQRKVMDAEAAYVAALSNVTTISRQGDELTLTGDETRLQFELEEPVPTAELTGTRWELETLLFGTGSDDVATDAAPAYLLLEEDGTVSGTTGCRELYGEWTENGDQITFTTFGARGKCPADLEEQDGHVVTVLGDGFQVEIEENRLTVVSQGDLGLIYLAGS